MVAVDAVYDQVKHWPWGSWKQACFDCLCSSISPAVARFMLYCWPAPAPLAIPQPCTSVSAWQRVFPQVVAEFSRRGAYFLKPEEKDQVGGSDAGKAAGFCLCRIAVIQ